MRGMKQRGVLDCQDVERATNGKTEQWHKTSDDREWGARRGFKAEGVNRRE